MTNSEFIVSDMLAADFESASPKSAQLKKLRKAAAAGAIGSRTTLPDTMPFFGEEAQEKIASALGDALRANTGYAYAPLLGAALGGAGTGIHDLLTRRKRKDKLKRILQGAGIGAGAGLSGKLIHDAGWKSFPGAFGSDPKEDPPGWFEPTKGKGVAAIIGGALGFSTGGNTRGHDKAYRILDKIRRQGGLSDDAITALKSKGVKPRTLIGELRGSAQGTASAKGGFWKWLTGQNQLAEAKKYLDPASITINGKTVQPIPGAAWDGVNVGGKTRGGLSDAEKKILARQLGGRRAEAAQGLSTIRKNLSWKRPLHSLKTIVGQRPRGTVRGVGGGVAGFLAYPILDALARKGYNTASEAFGDTIPAAPSFNIFGGGETK